MLLLRHCLRLEGCLHRLAIVIIRPRGNDGEARASMHLSTGPRLVLGLMQRDRRRRGEDRVRYCRVLGMWQVLRLRLRLVLVLVLVLGLGLRPGRRKRLRMMCKLRIVRTNGLLPSGY